MVLSRCMILLACFRWKYLTEGSSQSQVTKNKTIPTANSHSNFAWLQSCSTQGSPLMARVDAWANEQLL